MSSSPFADSGWKWCLIAVSASFAGCYGQASMSVGGPWQAPAVPADDVASPSDFGHDVTEEQAAEQEACVPSAPPAPYLRRLTNAEYAASVRDLLMRGTDALPVAPPPDVVLGGFDNRADALSVSLQLLKAYGDNAEKLVTDALASPQRPAIVGCDPAAQKDACQNAFVESFGRLAYRRPLLTEEKTALLGLAATATPDPDPYRGIALMMQAMLQSPSFVYREELQTTPGAGRRKLSGYELASRLSFTLWGTTPDKALLDAAANGGLDDEPNIRAHALRMMKDARAKTALTRFGQQWLRLTTLQSAPSSASATLKEAMAEETTRLLQDHLFTPGAPLLDLLTARYTHLNGTLASHYGITVPGLTVTPKLLLRMHAGGGALTDEKGVVWQADQGFIGGERYANPIPIAGTTTPSVYQSGRVGHTGYSLPVPAPGAYTLRLHFADLYLKSEGLRLLTVTAEGTPLFTNLDLVKVAGPATAHIVEAQVVVNDGALTLGFSAAADVTTLAALELFEPITQWVKVPVNTADKRGALLTHASILTLTAPTEVTAPILRGKYVREALLCDEPPPPPPNIPGADTLNAGESIRDRLARHRDDPACAGCHALMDPVGFGLEQYDNVGRYRTTDSSGTALTGAGNLLGAINPAFTGPYELAEKLRSSNKAPACVVKHLYRYAYGRQEKSSDECGVDALAKRFVGGGLQFEELVLSTVTSESFRFVGEAR